MHNKKLKLFILVSEDGYFWSHRLSLAKAALSAGYDVTVLTRVSCWEEKIKAQGINVVNINFIRNSQFPLTDVVTIIRLGHIFRKQRPDIIHNVALKIILLGNIAALGVKNTVVINLFSGLGYVFGSPKRKARMIKKLIMLVFRPLLKRSGTWNIFQNTSDMSFFEQEGLSNTAQNILIPGSGVDIEEFAVMPDDNRVPVVMLASRMLWDKGVGEFVEVAKRFQQETLTAKFVLVGAVDLKNPGSIPISTLEQWQHEGIVHWQGHSDDMPKMLSSASIICLPTSYPEGLPKVLLEAASVSRPMITTDTPGCRDIVRDGETGLLVNVQDVDSLFHAVKTLVLDKDMRERLGKNARRLVVAEFSDEIINRKTLQLYQRAVANNTG